MKTKIIENGKTIVSYAEAKPFTLYEMTSGVIIVFNYDKTVATSLTTDDSYTYSKNSISKFTLFEGKLEISNE